MTTHIKDYTERELKLMSCCPGCNPGSIGLYCADCEANLKLGRLIRAMPIDSRLIRERTRWSFDYDNTEKRLRWVVNRDTPEAAIEAAGGKM